MSAKELNHVVLADDDKDHGLLFFYVLKKVDPSRSLTIVKDGNELMEFLSHHIPDLLFLDLNMPGKNGFQCLSEIRQDEKLKQLTIVVYSSSTHMTDIQKSYLHQADLYMVKPFNSFHLKNALESILSMEWKQQQANCKYYFMNNRFVPFTAQSGTY
jgi:CheY-like chemotaxis protein